MSKISLHINPLLRQAQQSDLKLIEPAEMSRFILQFILATLFTIEVNGKIASFVF